MLGKRTIFQKKFSGIPQSISQNDLGSTVCDIARECDADIDPVNIEACYHLKLIHWSKKVVVKFPNRKDASEILTRNRKLKTTDQNGQKGFQPTQLFLLTTAFAHIIDFYGRDVKNYAHITNFYGRDVKNYGSKNPSHHSGPQIGPFELKKGKTPPQYWFRK